MLLCWGWPYSAELAVFVFPRHRGWKVQLLDKEITSVEHRFARSFSGADDVTGYMSLSKPGWLHIAAFHVAQWKIDLA